MSLKRTYSITVDEILANRIEQVIDSGQERNYTVLFRKALLYYLEKKEKEK